MLILVISIFCVTSAFATIDCPPVDGPKSVYLPHTDCTKFYQCSNGKPYLHNCSAPFHFNPTLNVCDYPERAGCASSSPPTDSGCNGSSSCRTTIPNIPTASLTTPGTDCDNDVDISNDCIREKIVCPPVDGPDSVYFPLTDCTKFCQCSNGKPYLHNCSAPLHFNPTLNVCDYPERAGCASSSPSTDSGCNGSSSCRTTIPTIPTPSLTTPGTDCDIDISNDCIREKIVCPPVDGPDSVYFPLTDCTKFCQCSNGKPYLHNCSAPLHFSPTLNVCDYPERAGCASSSPSTDSGCNGSSSCRTTIPTPSLTTPGTDCDNDVDISNDCIREKIVCPPVDGPDSVYFPLTDCTKFCQCSNEKPYLHNCSAPLHFSPTLNVCDYPERAGCASSSPSTDSGCNGSSSCRTTIPTPSLTTPGTDCDNDVDISNDCIREKIVCPPVDGPDSVYFPLTDCTKFCQCSNGKPYLHNCSAPLHFNPTLNVCDYPERAGCASSSPSTDSGCNGSSSCRTTIPTPSLTTPGTDCDNDVDISNDCIREKIVCPPVDGPDSVYFPLTDCTKFCQCSNGKPYLHNCSAPLHFSPTLNVCDYPERAGCASSSPSTDSGCNGSSSCRTTIPTPSLTTPGTDCDNVVDISNDCIREKIVCPPVDGPDSVYFPLTDCTKFCQCSNGNPYLHNCSAPLHFNPTLNVCDYPERAGCASSSPSTDSGCNGSSSCRTTISTIPTPSFTTPGTDCDNDVDISNDCIREKIVCPPVDGPDSVYFSLTDCTKFCQCSNGKPYLHNCLTPLHFNPTLNVCDWPGDEKCDVFT